MAKYLLMGDIHLSDRPPSSCTEQYNDQIFEILDATVTLAQDLNGLEAVIWAGDVFHHKTPGRTTHQTVSRAIQIANAYPVELWIVPGNHDLSHDRLGSIDEGQPLGTLFASGAAQLLQGQLLEHPVFGVPWLGRFTDDAVHAALAPYRAHLERHPGFRQLVVTHAPLYPPGRELPFEYYSTHDWAASMGYQGSVYYGHIHEAHGIYNTDGVTYCNPGAISRGSLDESNLTRIPSCAVWDSDTDTFEIIQLPADPPEKVFRLEEAKTAKERQLRLDTFLESVEATRIEITTTESVIAHVRGMRGLTDRVVKVVVDILEDIA